MCFEGSVPPKDPRPTPLAPVSSSSTVDPHSPSTCRHICHFLVLQAARSVPRAARGMIAARSRRSKGRTNGSKEREREDKDLRGLNASYQTRAPPTRPIVTVRAEVLHLGSRGMPERMRCSPADARSTRDNSATASISSQCDSVNIESGPVRPTAPDQWCNPAVEVDEQNSLVGRRTMCSQQQQEISARIRVGPRTPSRHARRFSRSVDHHIVAMDQVADGEDVLP